MGKIPMTLTRPCLLAESSSRSSPKVSILTPRPIEAKVAHSYLLTKPLIDQKQCCNHKYTSTKRPINKMPRRKRRTSGQTQQQIQATTTVALDLNGSHTSTNSEEEPSVEVHDHRTNAAEPTVDRDNTVNKIKGSVMFGPPSPSQANTKSKGNLHYLSDSSNGESTCSSSQETPKEIIRREQEERRRRQATSPSLSDNAQLASLGSAQLWVHRLLSTHYQTLHALGVERQDFPNTKLSLKQLETLLTPMLNLCNLMTTSQFGIQAPSSSLARSMTEVHYWKLWESDTIDIGIFFMPPNAVIPLHNHPGMSVVTRILYGSVQVTSYDFMSTRELETAQSQGDELHENAENVKWARVSREGEYVGESTMWLDPRRFNLHHIRANAEIGCALLDIMIPPYDNANRDCHHFKIIAERILTESSQRVVQMIETVTPDNHNEPTSRETAAAMNVE